MKKPRVGDVVTSKKEHDYLEIDKGAVGTILSVCSNDDGTREITVDFLESDRDEVIMDSGEVRLLVRNPRDVRAFQIEGGDIMITTDEDEKTFHRKMVVNGAYIEERDEMFFFFDDGDYLYCDPTDEVAIEDTHG